MAEMMAERLEMIGAQIKKVPDYQKNSEAGRLLTMVVGLLVVISGEVQQLKGKNDAN
jgi:hypothetical protein